MCLRSPRLGLTRLVHPSSPQRSRSCSLTPGAVWLAPQGGSCPIFISVKAMAEMGLVHSAPPSPPAEMQAGFDQLFSSVAEDRVPRRVLAVGPAALTRVSSASGLQKLYILGGDVAESVPKCTHLIASKVTRTVKFLTAVSVVKHIVTPEWLDESFRCQKFIGEWGGGALGPTCSLRAGFCPECPSICTLQTAHPVCCSGPLSAPGDTPQPPPIAAPLALEILTSSPHFCVGPFCSFLTSHFLNFFCIYTSLVSSTLHP